MSVTLQLRNNGLENGRITQEGTHEELIQREGLYAGIFRIQSDLYNEEREEA